MSDFLAFQIKQQDTDVIHLGITGHTHLIHAITSISVSKQTLLELQEEIKDFLSEQNLEVYWESDIPGLGATPCITLRLIPGSTPQEVLAEFYMELDDGTDFSRHTCCFYVHTTRPLLRNFSRSIPSLAESNSGEQLTLFGV